MRNSFLGVRKALRSRLTGGFEEKEDATQVKNKEKTSAPTSSSAPSRIQIRSKRKRYPSL